MPDGAAAATGWLWVAAELVLVALALSRLPTVVRVARRHRGPGPVAAIEAGLLAAGAPRVLAGIAATEAAMVGLGLGGWWRRAPAGGFSMHRRKSWTAIVLVLLGLLAAEGLAAHVVLARWSGIAAWIATALQAYGALWLAGDLHAVRLYPLRVTDDAIVVSVGLRWRMTIPRAAIRGIELGDTVPPGALAAKLIEPTVIISLDRAIDVRGPFGIRCSARAVALTVDEPERLIAALGAAPAVHTP